MNTSERRIALATGLTRSSLWQIRTSKQILDRILKCPGEGLNGVQGQVGPAGLDSAYRRARNAAQVCESVLLLVRGGPQIANALTLQTRAVPARTMRLCSAIQDGLGNETVTTKPILAVLRSGAT